MQALSTIAVLLCSANAAPTETITFDNPTAAVINARAWDETQQQWQDPKEKNPLFFDACHRFLLLKFPECAYFIHDEVASAKLVMRWKAQELFRVEGYHSRGPWRNAKVETPKWHAQAFLLRKPWTADAAVGPTWNAYINGAGYWRAGGGRDGTHDRFAKPLGEAGLWEAKPDGEIDVTAAFTSPAFGKTPAERLHRVASCGFLIRKKELYNRELPSPNWGTGPARIWIAKPKLVVTLKLHPGAKPNRQFQPPVDVKALAAQLKAKGGDGKPTTKVPDDLAELARKARRRRANMPDWMQRQVREVFEMKTQFDQRLHYRMYADLESGDRDRYLAAMNEILAHPPGWFFGHVHVDWMIPLLAYDDLLLDVVRYHLRLQMHVRWDPPYDRTFAPHRVGYYWGMNTLNLIAQNRAEAVLVGELLNMSDLLRHARAGLSLMDRQMIYNDGVLQEHGDSFYLGISLYSVQEIARYSRDPLTRLKARLAMEKMIFELAACHHPGLKRRVAPITRRYRLNDVLLAQSGPGIVMHMLSKQGSLIELDKPFVHPDPKLAARLAAKEKLTPREKVLAQGIPTLHVSSSVPQRMAILAPWGRPEDCHAIDDKPLPFTSIGTDRVRGTMLESTYYVTHLGKHYGLSSMHVDQGREWPILGAYRRADRPVERLDDLGVLFIWGYMNGLSMNHRGRHLEGVGVVTNPPFVALQHKNKMLYVMRPPERRRAAKYCKDGVRNVWNRVSLYGYGEALNARRELRINGRRVTTFPARADYGDVITLADGVSYLGLIALEPTELPRRKAVEITYTYPRLNFDTYLLDAEEPMPDDDATWAKLLEATVGWVVEMGDAAEYGSIDAFRKHLLEAKVMQRRDAKSHTLHVGYKSGNDRLELGLATDVVRPDAGQAQDPTKAVRYARVNGRSPYPERGIDLDCPLGQLGTAAHLAKAGAVLQTAEGRMALLKVEPVTGTYVGINPFIDPTPFRLVLPEGAVVRADGLLGCGRVAVRPKAGELRVDYRLPPEGSPAVSMLFEAAKRGEPAGAPVEAPMSRFVDTRIDIKQARAQSARFLLVRGLGEAPKVILNDKPLAGPFQTERGDDGTPWLRIPIVVEK